MEFTFKLKDNLKFDNKTIKMREIIKIIIFFFNLIILLKSLIYNIKKKIKKNYLIKKVKIAKSKAIKNAKIKLNENSFLKLYFENRTKFYILGRKKIMEKVGKSYDELNIKTIQDKMNWLLIHESPEYKTKIVDKILLREYAKKILNKDICPPIIKIYDNVDDINLKELPKQFILKCNHGSGMNIFCKDKSKFNLKLAKKRLNKWMKINYGLEKFEYVYMNIKKKIFAEKYLSDDMGVYKVDCYNGKPKFIRAYKKLQNKNYKICNIYNLNWTLTDIMTGLSSIKRDPKIKFKKPKKLKQLLDYSRKLSKEFAFVRVDFYINKNRIYLSELTFTTSNMMEPYKNRKQSIYLGNLLNIKKIKDFSNFSFF